MKTMEILQKLKDYANMYKDNIDNYTTDKVRSYVEGMNKGMDYIITAIDDIIRLGLVENESSK